jgi:hypothetical protein
VFARGFYPGKSNGAPETANKGVFPNVYISLSEISINYGFKGILSCAGDLKTHGRDFSMTPFKRCRWFAHCSTWHWAWENYDTRCQGLDGRKGEKVNGMMITYKQCKLVGRTINIGQQQRV